MLDLIGLGQSPHEVGEVAVEQAPTNVGFGSNCDHRHRLVLRLECDGEPTFGLERRLCGGDRTYINRLTNGNFVP